MAKYNVPNSIVTMAVLIAHVSVTEIQSVMWHLVFGVWTVDFNSPMFSFLFPLIVSFDCWKQKKWFGTIVSINVYCITLRISTLDAHAIDTTMIMILLGMLYSAEPPEIFQCYQKTLIFISQLNSFL